MKYYGTSVFLEYGLPADHAWLNARDVVAGKWGIRFEHIADCDVSRGFVDRIETHNESVSLNLAALYGKEWQTRFDQDVAAELALQSHVRDLIDRQPWIRERDSLLALERNDLYYHLEPTPRTRLSTARLFTDTAIRRKTRCWSRISD